MQLGLFTLCHRHLLALHPLDGGTVISFVGFTVGRLLHLAAERVGMVGALDWAWPVIPQLFLVLTPHFGNYKVDLGGNQLALLPSDWLALLIACPHLFTVGPSLP